MALSDLQRLRIGLSENFPEADSMFLDEVVNDFLTQAGGLNNTAYLLGWKAKAAEYANLVDVAEGNSSRAMSDLHKAALDMVDFYQGLVNDEAKAEFDGRRGRVVIGKISRGR